MNNNLKITVSFIVGAAAGVAASWFILKTRYEQIVNDEIAEFKAEYKQRMDEKKEATESLEKTNDTLKELMENAQDVEAVEKIIADNNYYVREDETFDDGKKEQDEPVEPRKKPYVIKPDELGDEQYRICVLTYYADGVLTNDYDEEIDDIEGTVGKENLKTFGQYEPDAIYVRNDELELDYEINRDVRRFVDIGPGDNEYDD